MSFVNRFMSFVNNLLSFVNNLLSFVNSLMNLISLVIILKLSFDIIVNSTPYVNIINTLLLLNLIKVLHKLY